MRRPLPVWETRFGMAPLDLYGHPRCTYEQEYAYTAPNLNRTGTLAPEARFERETSAPRDIPPYRPPGDARSTPAVPKMSIKAPTFSGTDLEDVTVWIWRTEVYL